MKTNEKKCPFCAEVIKVEAKICRFCNRDLEDDEDEEIEEVEARSGVVDGVKLGCGMFIVLPLLILFGGIVFIITLGSCGKTTEHSSDTKSQNSVNAAQSSTPKKRAQRQTLAAEMTGLQADNQNSKVMTSDEIMDLIKRKAIVSSALRGEWAKNIQSLGFVTRINCDPKIKRLPDCAAMAWFNLTWENWVSMSCKQKKQALSLVGKYCGRYTSAFADSNSERGFGGWTLSSGPIVYGPDFDICRTSAD